MGRWQVCMVKKDDRKARRTILYSKYLMSLKVGRILSSQEEVDHIDGDKTNDSIDNLQIVTRQENEKKFRDGMPCTKVTLECPKCGIIFKRRKGQTHLVPSKKATRTFCSRSCSSKFYNAV